METFNLAKASYNLVLLVGECVSYNVVNKKIIEQHKFSENVIAFTKPVKAFDYIVEADKNKSFGGLMPSFIFLDLNMTGYKGFEFIRKFNKLSNEFKNNCKMIVLSSYLNDMELDLVEENEYILTSISKPLMKNSLDLIELLANNNDSEGVEQRKIADWVNYF